jgi:glycosyltransferase involved in cell wall biosynthesis
LPDGPDGETVAALGQYPEIRQLTSERAEGTAACFNRLASHTDSEIIVLLESGVRPGPDWLKHLLSTFASDEGCGLAGPSTNQCWNQQGAFSGAKSDPESIAGTAREAVRRFGSARRTLEPLYSLADFCYAVRREVFQKIGPADEGYGLGPCWEMDYNIRAARAGFRGLWTCASYVHRASIPQRRRDRELELFEANKRRYQDKFCGLKLQGMRTGYRSHCRGDACSNFAPAPLFAIRPTPLKPAYPAASSSATGGVQVSCIMPTCDRRAFVSRAIGCFLAQNYPGLELIIVDDGRDPVADLIHSDPRIRYFRLSRKLTIGAKRNYACQQAHGDIVVHWDDDDWYPANRVRRQVEAMLASGAGICGTSRLYYRDADGDRAFLYQHEGSARAWVAGNTLAYCRTIWQNHPFADVQVAEDARFIWSASDSSVQDLKDPTLCVATIHRDNTSPKMTSGAYWTACSMEEIHKLTGELRAAGHLTVPLISCIMPTYNRRPFIRLALECFAAQTYPRKELVVVDDGTDPVVDLLEGVRDVVYRRLARRLSIGAKRNLACEEARGDIIAHQDDDDWYAPDRLELQVTPILNGHADMTGLTNRFLLDVREARFWSTADALHRRMFVGDVHGGTLVYRKSILRDDIQYPEINLAEDAILIQQALRRRKRLLRLENTGAFVYLRHGANAWKFEAGRFLDSAGWRPTTAPERFAPELCARYQAAVMEGGL